MKNIPLLLLLLWSAMAADVSAQSRRRSDGPEQRFVVGVAPFSLLTRSGKINVHGEWAYADNKSLSILLGVPRRSKAPGWLANDISLDNQGRTVTNDFYGFGAVVENRFYLGSEAPRGFYLAPYARYNRVWLTNTKTNPDNQGETTITGAVGGFGLGGSLGWQFRLGDQITLDATLAGVDFKWMRGKLTYSTTDPDNNIAQFRDEVQEVVEDIPFIGSRLSAEIEGDRVQVRTPGVPLPAYRFNLTVNYAF